MTCNSKAVLGFNFRMTLLFLSSLMSYFKLSHERGWLGSVRRRRENKKITIRNFKSMAKRQNRLAYNSRKATGDFSSLFYHKSKSSFSPIIASSSLLPWPSALASSRPPPPSASSGPGRRGRPRQSRGRQLFLERKQNNEFRKLNRKTFFFFKKTFWGVFMSVYRRSV